MNQSRTQLLRIINQDQDENVDPKKLEIDNFKQVLLFSGIIKDQI
jgi:hypothetical protein